MKYFHLKFKNCFYVFLCESEQNRRLGLGKSSAAVLPGTELPKTTAKAGRVAQVCNTCLTSLGPESQYCLKRKTEQ
jgi:hypothetical protein